MLLVWIEMNLMLFDSSVKIVGLNISNPGGTKKLLQEQRCSYHSILHLQMGHAYLILMKHLVVSEWDSPCMKIKLQIQENLNHSNPLLMRILHVIWETLGDLEEIKTLALKALKYLLTFFFAVTGTLCFIEHVQLALHLVSWRKYTRWVLIHLHDFLFICTHLKAQLKRYSVNWELNTAKFWREGGRQREYTSQWKIQYLHNTHLVQENHTTSQYTHKIKPQLTFVVVFG